MRRILGIAALLVVALLVGLPMLGGAPDLSALPPRDRAVEIGNGTLLNVREVGSGTPVVLVHGLPSNSGDWASVPEKLAALGHPERVGGLVLLASVGPSSPDAPTDLIGQLGALPIGPPLFRYLTSVPALGRGVIEGALAELFSGAGNIPPGFRERSGAQMALPGTVDSWLAEERNDGYSKLRPEAIQTPTLILHGDDDRGVPAAVSEDLAKRLPKGKLVSVQGGSHMLPVTHPDLVAARVHEWVTQP